MLFTSRLALSKPENGPGTDDIVDSDVLAANFDVIDANMSAKVCTSATRPDNGANGVRYTGQWIFETDTKAYGMWNGTVWRMFDTQPQTFDNFTVSATGGGLNLGTTGASRTSKYYRQGKMFKHWGRIQFGSAGVVVGTGNYTFESPFSFQDAPSNQIAMGTAWFRDVAPVNDYHGFILISASTSLTVRGLDGTATSSLWGPANPIAPQVNDWLSFEYEAEMV